MKNLKMLILVLALCISGIALDFTTTYVAITVFKGVEENSVVRGLISQGWWPWLTVDMVLFSILILGGLILRKMIQTPDLQDWAFTPAIFCSWAKLAVGGANLILILGA